MSVIVPLLCIIVPALVMSQMTGGFKNLDVNSDDVKQLANTAMETVNQQSNDAFQLVPVKILSAKTQVVAGTNTVLEILVGRSTCLKSMMSSTGDTCDAVADPNADNNQQIYTVSIWEKPWENFTQVTINSSKAA